MGANLRSLFCVLETVHCYNTVCPRVKVVTRVHLGSLRQMLCKNEHGQV